MKLQVVLGSIRSYALASGTLTVEVKAWVSTPRQATPQTDPVLIRKSVCEAGAFDLIELWAHLGLRRYPG